MSLRVACVILVLGVGFSREAPAQGLELTEDDAVRRVVPDAAAARRLDVPLAGAQADLAAARQLPNPQLTLGQAPVIGGTERFAFVSERLPIATRVLDLRAARQRLAAATLRAEDAGQQVKADVRLAFATLLAAQSRADAVEAALTRLRGVAESLAKREEAGESAGFDRLRADREVAELEATLADASEARARAQAQLARFFAGDVDPRTLRAKTPEAAAAAPQLPADTVLVARALEGRNVQALERELESARFARRAAAWSRIPEPELTAGVGRSSVAPRENNALFSVGVSIPLFNPRAAEHARAVVLEREVGAALNLQRTEVRASVLALASIVTQRRAAVARYRVAAVERASQLERVATTGYENGVRGVLELLDAYRTGASARLRLADLELELRGAELELEGLTGAPLR